MNSNIEKIIAQFEALQKEFHRPRGSLIHTLDQNLAKKLPKPGLIWKSIPQKKFLIEF